MGVSPVRPNWSGLVPVPGDGRYEWAGYLPIRELPHLANPGLDSGFLLVDLYHFGFGAIVLGFEGSALNTPSLFLTDRFVPAYSLIQLVVTAAIFYVAVLCSSRGAPRRLRRRFASRAVGLICLEGLSKTEGGRCGT